MTGRLSTADSALFEAPRPHPLHIDRIGLSMDVPLLFWVDLRSIQEEQACHVQDPDGL